MFLDRLEVAINKCQLLVYQHTVTLTNFVCTQQFLKNLCRLWLQFKLFSCVSDQFAREIAPSGHLISICLYVYLFFVSYLYILMCGTRSWRWSRFANYLQRTISQTIFPPKPMEMSFHGKTIVDNYFATKFCICTSTAQLLRYVLNFIIMMPSSNGNIFHIAGTLCGEFTGHRWIPHTKATDAELWCFLWTAPE